MANITENTNINLNLSDTGLAGQIQLNIQINVTNYYGLGASTVLDGVAISNQQTIAAVEPYSSTIQYTVSKMVTEGVNSLFSVTLTSPNQGEPFLHPDSSNTTTYHQSFFSDLDLQFSGPINIDITNDEFGGHIMGTPTSLSSNSITMSFVCNNITEELAENALVINISPNFSTGSISAVQEDGSFGGLISVPDEETTVNVQIVQDGLTYMGNFNVVDTNSPAASSSVSQSSPNELSIVTNENTGADRHYFVDLFAVENSTSQYNFRIKVMQAFGQNIYAILPDVGFLDLDIPNVTIEGLNTSGLTTGVYTDNIFTFPAIGSMGITSDLILDTFTPESWPAGVVAVEVTMPSTLTTSSGEVGIPDYVENVSQDQFRIVDGEFVDVAASNGWVTPGTNIAPNYGNFFFNVEPNTTTEERIALITYYHPQDPTETDIIIIKQEAGFDASQDTTVVKYNSTQSLADGTTFNALSDVYSNNLDFADGVELIHPLEIDRDVNSFILLLNCPNIDPGDTPSLEIEPFPNSDIYYGSMDNFEYISNGQMAIDTVHPAVNNENFTHYVKVSINQFVEQIFSFAPGNQIQANDTPYRLFKINITHPNNITGTPDALVVIRQFGRAVTFFKQLGVPDSGASYGSTDLIGNLTVLSYTEGGLTIPMYTSSRAGILNLTQPLIATGELPDGSVDTGEYVQPIVAATKYYAYYDNGNAASVGDSGGTGAFNGYGGMGDTSWQPAETGDTVWPGQPDYLTLSFDSTNAQTGLYNLNVTLPSWTPAEPTSVFADGGSFAYREFTLTCWNGNVVQGGVATEDFKLSEKRDQIRIIQYPTEPSFIKFERVLAGGLGAFANQDVGVNYGIENVFTDMMPHNTVDQSLVFGGSNPSYYCTDGMDVVGNINTGHFPLSTLDLMNVEIFYISNSGQALLYFEPLFPYEYQRQIPGTAQFAPIGYTGDGDYYMIEGTTGEAIHVFTLTDTVDSTINYNDITVDKRKIKFAFTNPGDHIGVAPTVAGAIHTIALRITHNGNNGNLIVDENQVLDIADSVTPHLCKIYQYKYFNPNHPDIDPQTTVQLTS